MRRLIVVWILCLLGLVRAYAAETDPAAPESQQQILVLLKLAPAHFRPSASYGSGYADASGSAARHRIATALARRNGLGAVTDWPMPILGVDCYVMLVPAPRHATDVAAEIARDPAVSWAQPMNVFRSLSHDDPLWSLQPAAREWHLSELHAAMTGRGIRVAIIDSGVQLDHPDLVGQVVLHANFVGDRDAVESHGTAVAGIVAARADNHAGIVGVAPQARLLALRACRQVSPAETVCTSLSLALALHAAIDGGAQVVNLSLSGPHDRLIQQLVEAAMGRGVRVVAAADPADPQGGFPAAIEGVVAVAQESSAIVRAGMVLAPGLDIPTTLPESRWSLVSGASYAAAHVSGLLALLLEAHDRRQVLSPSSGADLVTHADGRIDACASVGRAGGHCVCECPGAAQAAVSVIPR